MNDPGSPADRKVCFCRAVSTESWERYQLDCNGDLECAQTRSQVGSGPCGGACGPLWNPEWKDSPWDPAVIEAVSLFNRGYYWETHEVLEHLWLEETTRIRKLYQGLIQASAALYHVLNANPKGVGRLVDESCAKLQDFRPKYQGLDLEPLIAALIAFKSQADDIASSRRQNFDYDQLPRIVLGPWMA
jgi:hypothetical protein